jgi:hypothetical protein
LRFNILALDLIYIGIIMAIHSLEKSAHQAIQILRKKKLNSGQPFMINSDMLESSQCFLEYPDGSFKVAEADSKGLDFRIVMDISPETAKHIRKQLNLI